MEGVGVEAVTTVTPTPVKATKSDSFVSLIKTVSDLQAEFERLQKEITQTKESWNAEQRIHDKEIRDRNIQEEGERNRNKETYEYEIARKHKIAEDEFTDKKAVWEKSLREQQEILQKELIFKFETARKLKEQENKSGTKPQISEVASAN